MSIGNQSRSAVLVLSLFALGAALSGDAHARGGAGITGSQGAGARTGFGPPIGINDNYHSGGYGRDYYTYPGYYADGYAGTQACRFERNGWSSYPSYVRICN